MVELVEHQLERTRRLSLTKKQLLSDSGAELLRLLSEILADGILSDQEISRLQDWLGHHQHDDIPAIAYLSHLVEGVIANGSLEVSDRHDLQVAIEKALPVAERHAAEGAREREEAAKGRPPSGGDRFSKADLNSMRDDGGLKAARESMHSWRDDPMTARQLEFIRSRNGSIERNATKGAASDLIDSLLDNTAVSSRQQMVLRFWNRTPQIGEGRRQIVQWMDEFYNEDPDRKLAWELYKDEAEDNGLQGDPCRVPVGVGEQYLARIRAGGSAAIPRFRTEERRPGSSSLPVVVVTIAVLVFIGILVRVAHSGSNGSLAVIQAHQAEPVPATAFSSQPSDSIDGSEPKESEGPAKPTQKQLKFFITQHAVRNLLIDGIFGGAKRRLSIGGRLIAEGDPIDFDSDIVVQQIDLANRSVVFIDSAGNSVTRKLGQ